MCEYQDFELAIIRLSCDSRP